MGPQFLYEPEENWPNRVTSCNGHVNEPDDVYEFAGTVIEKFQFPLPRIERFSSRRRLIRSTACIRRYVNNCRKLTQTGELTVSEINAAEQLWIKSPQSVSFHSEYSELVASVAGARVEKQ